MRSGTTTKLNEPELARWKLRLLIETGFATPAVISLLPVPGASSIQRKVYDGLRLLLEARSLSEESTPFPFTAAFASRWCLVSEEQAKRSIQWLRSVGVLVHVGQTPVGPHRANLYVTAPTALASVSVSAV